MASVVDIAPPRPVATPSFRKIRAASRGSLSCSRRLVLAVFVGLAIRGLGGAVLSRGRR